jgi:hypothetical protein
MHIDVDGKSKGGLHVPKFGFGGNVYVDAKFIKVMLS